MYKNYFITIFSLFTFSITTLSYTLILPIAPLKAQQLTTSQIRLLWIKYLIQTDNVLVLLLHPNLMKNLAYVYWLSTRFRDNSEVVYFFEHPVSCSLLAATLRRLLSVTPWLYTNCCQIVIGLQTPVVSLASHQRVSRSELIKTCELSSLLARESFSLVQRAFGVGSWISNIVNIVNMPRNAPQHRYF